MSVARIIALSGIGVAVFFLLVITIQYLVDSKKSKGVGINERRKGNQNSKFDD